MDKDTYTASYVFDCILRDNIFMECIDEYITTTIASTKTFDAKHVPQMVLIIMTLLDTHNNYVDVKKHIKNDEELKQLLELFYEYIFNFLKSKVQAEGSKVQAELFNKKEFKQSFDICCRLAILKLKFKNKSGFFCVGK
jgi:hypothetical protein